MGAIIFRYRHASSRRNQAVRLLTDKGPLRAGLEANAAVDTLWLLMSPDNYYRLVHERGWTKAKYQRWLADTIEQLLLPAHP